MKMIEITVNGLTFIMGSEEAKNFLLEAIKAYEEKLMKQDE